MILTNLESVNKLQLIKSASNSKGTVRFRHRTCLVKVRKTSCFGLNYLFWSPQTQLEKCPTFSSKVSSGFTLTNVEKL